MENTIIIRDCLPGKTKTYLEHTFFMFPATLSNRFNSTQTRIHSHTYIKGTDLKNRNTNIISDCFQGRKKGETYCF